MNKTFTESPSISNIFKLSWKSKNKSKVKIGVVPTHLMFVGALAPDESGKLPCTRSGDLKIVSGMLLLVAPSPVKLNTVQVTLFPGTNAKDLQDMFKGLKSLKLEVHLIMMVGVQTLSTPRTKTQLLACSIRS